MTIKKGRDQILFNILSYLLVGLFALICVIPFYLIIVGSLTSEHTIITEGYDFFVKIKDFSIEAYRIRTAF